MKKLHILIIGGDEDRVPERIKNAFEITHRRVSRDVLSGASRTIEAVVIIMKFKDAQAVSVGKDLAKSMGIPCLLSPTWGQVIGIVADCDQLKPRNDYLKEKSADTKELSTEVAVAATPETDAGVSERELWTIYQDMATDTVRCLMKVGEKLHVAELLPTFASEMSLSERDTRLLMTRLHGAGVISNIAGDTWKLLPYGGQNYEYIMDREEVPVPRESTESQITKMVGFLKGLHPGPYPSKSSIQEAMMRHAEFSKTDGRPLHKTQCYRVVTRAIETGVITIDGDSFIIDNDPSITLTPIERPAEEKKEEPKPEQKPEPEKPELKVSDDVKFLRGMIGRIESGDTPREAILGVKSMVPQRQWDECAAQTVITILRKKGVDPKAVVPKDLFSPEDWNTLAWELLRKMPFELVAPILSVTYTDETLTCSDCGRDFVFSRGEKLFFLERQFTTPRRCKVCRGQKGATPSALRTAE